jgi:hypothetical protein
MAKPQLRPIEGRADQKTMKKFGGCETFGDRMTELPFKIPLFHFIGYDSKIFRQTWSLMASFCSHSWNRYVMVGWVNDLHEIGVPERGRQSSDEPAEQSSSEFKVKEWILIE